MTPHVVCFGELLLRLSAPGYERLLQSPHLQVFFGGAEANAAAALCAFGTPAAVVTALPDNALGSAAIAYLRSQGIDTSQVAMKPGRMGLYFHTQGAMQRASEVVYDRTNSVFALTDPDAFDWNGILKGVKWLHLSGITAAVSERGAQSALRALQAAKRMNAQTSFDCNYRARVWGERAAGAPAILKELCALADLLFADDRDVALMLGNAATTATAFQQFPALKWIARTRRNVQAVEQQSYSGELFTRKNEFRSRAHDLNGIVERIGAGDAFAAGILHRLISNDQDLQGAIDFATAAACYKHSLPGDACIASVTDIEALLAGGTADIKR